MKTPLEALNTVRERFPFRDYINGQGASDEEYLLIARVALKYLPIGSTILDFGCGPADKTAVLQELGYKCSGIDDLQDEWHLIGDNQKKIMQFTQSIGIDFRLADSTDSFSTLNKKDFDMVMLNAVIEHLHNSPRELLNSLVDHIRPNGLLFITVPNAVNIRKRVDVIRGRTNMPPYKSFYWSSTPWRGHVREYVKNDLIQMAEYLGLKVLECRGCDTMLSKVPKFALPFYLAITKIFDGWKDAWMIVAQKPTNWTPRIAPPQS